MVYDIILKKGVIYMGKIKRNKMLLFIFSVIIILFMYWLFRFPLNRQVNMSMTLEKFDRNIITIQNTDNKYFVLLKIALSGINIEKDTNIASLNLQSMKPIKAECTKEQYDYIGSLAEKEQRIKIDFTNNYFHPSEFKIISVK
jgi:hypothetical protein